jgi:hypothetical protein
LSLQLLRHNPCMDMLRQSVSHTTPHEHRRG